MPPGTRQRHYAIVVTLDVHDNTTTSDIALLADIRLGDNPNATVFELRDRAGELG